MIVNIEEVRKLKERLAEINSVPFNEIEWHENGQEIQIEDIEKDQWKFTGLSNTCWVDFSGAILYAKM